MVVVVVVMVVVVVVVVAVVVMVVVVMEVISLGRTNTPMLEYRHFARCRRLRWRVVSLMS